METPLDILMKATHYVENQEKSGSIRRPANPALPNDDRVIKENGHSDHIASSHRKTGIPAEEIISQHLLDKQQISRYSLAQDESDRKRGSMRFTEVGSTDETASMSQYNRNITNEILPQRIYGVDEKIAYRSSASPLKSSPRKRSSSPNSRTETEQPAKMHMPQQLHPLVATANQAVGQLPTANPVMPFVHPFYSALDPALYAEAMARHTLTNNDAGRSGASPSSTTTAHSIAESLPSQGLPRLMYPLSNSALLMAPRAPAAAGFDIPMVIPPQFAAAYGQTAGLLPQQFAAWSASVPDADKRLLESMAAGVPTQQFPAQWLASPYLKNFFAVPNSDLTSSKDANRSAPKPTVPATMGLPSFPPNYTAEFSLKYPEALSSELLRQQDKALASQSMSPRISPENSKKPVVSPHHPSAVPFPAQVLNPASLTKSPIMDWKVPTSTSRSIKTEGGQMSFESRPNNQTARRDAAYGDNRDNQIKADEARHKLAGLTQRPGSSNDLYAARYNSHERQSPSPYATDRWDYRRRSRDFSPHLSPNASEKVTKKRSHEGFGIPRDLIPSELKNHSPSAHGSIGGLRQSNSPQRGPCRSPMEHPTQASVASGLFASLAGKPNHSASEKDNPAYFAPHPYMLHSAFSGYPYSFALPANAASYLCQPEINGPGSNKAVADAIAVAAQAQAAGSQLFRSALSPEQSALTAEFAARLAGMSHYGPLLQQQQQLQQALKAMSPSTSVTADYATTALKQAAAMQQSLFLDGRDKDRGASPSHASITAARRFMSNTNMSPAPKMARASPVLTQNKANIKNSTSNLNHLYKARPASPPVRTSDGRPAKREPSPGLKRPPAATVSPHGFPRFQTSNPHPGEDGRNNILKRKAMEDRNERDFAKDASSLKRKRELTTANTVDVDEHFRRSLGSDYKESEQQNKVRITGSVDDHFQKALGNDVWSKLKPNKASGSPIAQDPIPNGRDLRALPAAAPSNLPPYSLYHLTSMQGTPGAFTSHPGHPMMSAAGSRTVKSGGTAYPELTADGSMSNASSSSAQSASDLRSDSTKRASAFAESRSQPPAYDAVARRPGEAKDTNRHSSTSPIDKIKKYSYSQNCSPRSNSSQNSGDRPPAPVVSDTHQGAAVPPQALHSIPNGFSKSPNKPPPPAYSPQSSTSASSLPVATSPARPSLDRQPSEESSKSVPPMPVQT